MRKVILLLAGFALTSNVVPIAQSAPNFSGTWTQVRATTAPPATPSTRQRGDGSGTAASAGNVSSAGTAGSAGLDGAAFNCSLECTMVQTATTLTIKRPTDAKGFTPPDVVLKLDGNDSTNTQLDRAGGQPRPYVATAKRNGQTLVVARPWGNGTTLTQTLSLDDGKLTILYAVTGITPHTLTYTRKK